MKQNIKIPEGYKNSSLGVIPEEWEVKKFRDICSESRLGGNYENGSSKKGIPIIKMGNINRGKININELCYFSDYSNFNKADILKRDDLLFNTRNTLDLVGKVAIWKNELPLAIYNSNLLRMYFYKYCMFSNDYANYYFNSSLALRQLKKYATGTTSVAAIYTRDLNNLLFVLPNIKEQQQIAKILTTWDEAIEKQTKIINLLEKRKHGLMQQLLTGKKRLKGFTDKWEMKDLSNVSNIKKGKQVNKIDLNTNSKFPAINGGIGPSGWLNKYNTEENTITISEGGNSCGFINLIKTKFWCGGHCYAVKEKKIIQKYFLFYILKFNEKRIMNLRVGSGLPNIQSKSLLGFKIKFPTLSEQTAISKILTEADNEINLAKQKLEHLQQQKKGLMQVLLTGKKRVKLN